MEFFATFFFAFHFTFLATQFRTRVSARVQFLWTFFSTHTWFGTFLGTEVSTGQLHSAGFTALDIEIFVVMTVVSILMTSSFALHLDFEITILVSSFAFEALISTVVSALSFSYAPLD
jgi:hypothetical protein